MNRVIIFLLMLLPFTIKAQVAHPVTPEDMEKAVSQIMLRVVGSRAYDFNFSYIPATNEPEFFEVSAKNGNIVIKGNSIVAMAKGAYEYLQKACYVQYNHNSGKITLPKSLPDFTIPKTPAQTDYRIYLNSKTYDKSLAYWQWEDWEKEIDIMALHGINAPLSLLGQEAVWQAVYEKMGIRGTQLDNFFSSPSFQMATFRGNNAGVNPALPQSYINKTKELQNKILSRMLQLGMKPIVPTFNGVVPPAYIKRNPNAEHFVISAKNNLKKENNAYVLQPGTTDFLNIGMSFIETYRKLYGKAVNFTFELPEISEQEIIGTGVSQKLGLFGSSIYNSIVATVPDGKLFINCNADKNASAFEKANNVATLASNIDNKSVFVIVNTSDVANFQLPTQLINKNWILNINIQSDYFIDSNLENALQTISQTLKNKKNNCVGVGYAPYKHNTNEITFNAIEAQLWSNTNIGNEDFLLNFFSARYGAKSKEFIEIWEPAINLYESFGETNSKFALQQNPGFIDYNSHINFYESATNLIKYAEKNTVKNNILLNDVATLTSTYAMHIIDRLISEASKSYAGGNSQKSKELFEKALKLITTVDGINFNIYSNRLETIISRAANIASNSKDSAYFIDDVKKMLVDNNMSRLSVVEGQNERLMSGFIREFYAERWKVFVNNLFTNKKSSLVNFNENFIKKPKMSRAITIANSIESYKKIVDEIRNIETKDIPAINIVFTKANDNGVLVSLSNSLSFGEVFYTTNSNRPSEDATKYTQNFKAEEGNIISAVIIGENGMKSQVATKKIPVSLFKAVNVQPVDKVEGNIRIVNDGVSSDAYNSSQCIKINSTNATVLFDLGKTDNFSKVEIGFFGDNQNNFVIPNFISVETSNDNNSFKKVKEMDILAKGDKGKKVIHIDLDKQSARYIRINLTDRTGKNLISRIVIDEISVL